MSLCEKSGLRVALFCNIYEDVEGFCCGIKVERANAEKEYMGLTTWEIPCDTRQIFQL